MTLSADPQGRLERARIALEGLRMADSLGGFFEFNAQLVQLYMQEKRLPGGIWRFTDDTNMALSIYTVLREHGEINQDALATSFAENFDLFRRYGMGAIHLMHRLQAGYPWRPEAQSLFNGTGSYGNGGAMRVTPLGAYFADDMSVLVEQAALSAEVTHAHAEGIAGAVAAAVAAGVACQLCDGGDRPSAADFINHVLPYIPQSQVRNGLLKARDIAHRTSVVNAAEMLGNGSDVSAQDTVPFTVYMAGKFLDDYETAFWQTASVGGDVDTTCAIVGGIVSSYTGTEAIPAEWLEHREPFLGWDID